MPWEKGKAQEEVGPGIFPKKDVDPKSISEALTFYVKDMGLARAFDMSPYGDSMTKSAACSGKGLVKCSKLLSALHALEPTLSFKFVHMKEGLGSFGTGPTLEHWARTTADTILTVLSHTRRLKDEIRHTEAGAAQEAEQRKQAKHRKQRRNNKQRLEVLQRKWRSQQLASKQAAKTTAEDKAQFKMISSMEVPQTPPVDGYSQDADCCSPAPTKKAVLKQQIGILKKPASSQARFVNVRTALPAFMTA